MTATGHTTAPPLNPGLPARLALLPPGTGLHRIDGAWWPRSHDLGRELPGLLAAWRSAGPVSPG
jgi:hypothetical protein